MFRNYDTWKLSTPSEYEQDEYVDDWYCRDCGEGPLPENMDSCPSCNNAWSESERPIHEKG